MENSFEQGNIGVVDPHAVINQAYAELYATGAFDSEAGVLDDLAHAYTQGRLSTEEFLSGVRGVVEDRASFYH